jgi:hypothetical protein
LITHINEEGINAPVKEEKVPFEAGKKRGKVYVPTYTEAEMEAIRRSDAVAEAVRLDDDEEAALGIATVDDLVSIRSQAFLLSKCNKMKSVKLKTTYLRVLPL